MTSGDGRGEYHKANLPKPRKKRANKIPSD